MPTPLPDLTEKLPPLQARNAWRVLFLLALINLLNFYDRTIPAAVVEPIKAEFGLADTHIGVLGGAFTVVYAGAGLHLGKLADRASRKRVMGWGLVAWSGFTAASGAVVNFATLLLTRLGVGVGEAAYAPAANSTIADLFPPQKRSRAVAVFSLGLPLGLTLAFFTTGAMVDAFGSWRAPFLVASVPGLLLAAAVFVMREPVRGASERLAAPTAEVDRPIRTLLAVPTMRWLVVSGIGLQVASYSVATFLVPLFQRWFGASLTVAATNTGVVLGLTGLVGLLLGGFVADRAARRSPRGRVLVGAGCLTAAVPLTLAALLLDRGRSGLFVVLFGLGWLLVYQYYTAVYPAIADIVAPGLRSTAVAVYFAAMYLLGGAIGPVVTGVLSDRIADAQGGASEAAAEARGLHDSLLFVVPPSLALTALALYLAARTIHADHDARLRRPVAESR
ncbi:MFS transporter [Streptomyces chumphonensis]|uniref:spinster family MFS transporter n=1 Tax=Streptomyces chumphonensis TaxID=1214925 RepID=UPI00296451BF|nr:MFS transporter [Streptomyces chumphonensis]